jgi:hypothetical protein
MTSEQMRAARALLRWEQKDLSAASGVPLQTIKRLELKLGELGAYQRTVDALKGAIETAGVLFLDDGANVSGGPGVRLRKPGTFGIRSSSD